MQENRLSVSKLNLLISQELSLSPFLRHVQVEGELTRFVRHASGHIYFTLKDDFSSIDCTMFRSDAQRLSELFEEGDRVALTGRVSIYEKNARLQLYARTMHPLGEGIYLRQFALLKEKLEEEGLLDPLKKRPLPGFPARVALLTSETGAAKSDFLKIFRARNPLAEVRLYPIPLQGEGTASAIVDTLLEIADEPIDLVVVTRGGGSYEDLREFNDETLARVLADYVHPTLCAIGHEIDFTIAEFAADARGATPTDAAQMATQDIYAFLDRIRTSLQSSARRSYESVIHQKEKLRLDVLENLKFSFLRRSAQSSRRAEMLIESARRTLLHRLDTEKKNLVMSAAHLESLNPLHILSRGYSLLLHEGKPVTAITNLKTGDKIENVTSTGRIVSMIEEIQHEIQ